MNLEEWSVGIIRFKQDVYVDEAVLGKMIMIKKNEARITFEFPVAASARDGIDYLEKPPHSLNYKVTWGRVYQRPIIKAGVLAIACFTNSIKDDDLFDILSSWRIKFIDIMEIINECIIPKTPTIRIEKFPDGTIDFYSGISMSQMLSNGQSVPIHDMRNPKPIEVHIIDKDCYADFSTVIKAAIRAFDEESLPQTYYLLLDAYHAFKNEDYRSAVTLGAIALEHCIQIMIKAFTEENNIAIKFPIGELGRKFEKLGKLGIEILVPNYKEEILKLRNDVLHKGVQVSRVEAYNYLKNCRKIIDAYEPLLKSEDETVKYIGGFQVAYGDIAE